MSRADTWMPLYVADYLRDTMRLTTEQHGAYLLLLLECWNHGGELPAADAELAAIARLPLPAWRRHKPVLARFFMVDAETWAHKRVKAEHEKAARLSEVSRRNGQRGGRPRSQTEPDNNPPGSAQGARQGGRNETPAYVAPPLTPPTEDNPSSDEDGNAREARARPSKPKPTKADFASWWAVYPKRKDKITAEAAFAKAWARIEVDDRLAVLTEAAKAYAERTDPNFLKHPATWLNAGSWMDEDTTVIPFPKALSPTDRIAAEHAAASERAREILRSRGYGDA